MSDLQRQLKLLSEQVGALAARVDSLEKPGPVARGAGESRRDKREAPQKS